MGMEQKVQPDRLPALAPRCSQRIDLVSLRTREHEIETALPVDEIGMSSDLHTLRPFRRS